MASDCLVVIPAYNEADTIEEVVSRAAAFADVCVVDDASTDDTGAIVDALEGVYCIHHEKNTHIAGGILDGFRFARTHEYPFCITMDAGLSHEPDAIPAFLEKRDADLVVGVRRRLIDVPLYRKALSRAGTALMNLALEKRYFPWGGARLQDVTSGYRMYSRQAYSLLADAPMKSRSFDFHLEAIAYVFRAGLRIEEIPIAYHFSNSSLQPAIVKEALRTCARLWVEDLA